MELRLLRYFLTVAKEQSFTKAAEQLHITQPTLSRQMAAFEEDLGITLFIRNGKKISLTDEGILLKRRALEILNLEERTLEELKGKEEVVEGTITIGCGEFAAVETLAKICKTYKEKYPLVQIVLHTATADAVYEMMNKGLVDIALFMEPVDTEGLDYIRITDCDHWCVGMRPDDPLAEKEFKKNKTGNKQISDNRDLKSNRGRKKEKPIQGIVLKHYECLKLLITLYQDGAMGIKKETSQVALARYIDDKKLLGNIRNGIFIPLKFSTILKETNTIWNEMLRDKSIGIK